MSPEIISKEHRCQTVSEMPGLQELRDVGQPLRSGAIRGIYTKASKNGRNLSSGSGKTDSRPVCVLRKQSRTAAGNVWF